MTRTASTHRAHFAVTLAVVCGAVLAACGSSSPSTSSSGAAGSTGTQTSSAAATSSGTGSVPTSCPTAAAVSAAAGMTYPAPTQQAASGSLYCTYADPTSGADLVIVASVAPGTTAAVLQQVAQSQAAAQHVSSAAVPGLGDAAFSMTLDDAATNSLHVATSIIEAVKGSVLYDVTAEATLDQVEAVVRLLIGQ
jgi:hypothetical protein